MMHWRDYDFKIETKGEADGLASFVGIATTNDPDHVQDIIEIGAFGDVNPQKVALLRDHDPRALVGGWTSFVQNGTELVAEGVVTTRTEKGAETYHLMDQKFLNGLSVGFHILPGGSARDQKTRQRRITKALLLE